jgi:hypothetical protein
MVFSAILRGMPKRPVAGLPPLIPGRPGHLPAYRSKRPLSRAIAAVPEELLAHPLRMTFPVADNGRPPDRGVSKNHAVNTAKVSTLLDTLRTHRAAHRRAPSSSGTNAC